MVCICLLLISFNTYQKLIANAKYKDGWTCKWLAVKSLISFDQGVMIYKILHGLCPENLRLKFTERSMISEYRTRNGGDLQISKVRLEYAKRSFYFSGVKNWNDIPDNVRGRDSIARFRTGLSFTGPKHDPLVEQQFTSSSMFSFLLVLNVSRILLLKGTSCINNDKMKNEMKKYQFMTSTSCDADKAQILTGSRNAWKSFNLASQKSFNDITTYQPFKKKSVVQDEFLVPFCEK